MTRKSERSIGQAISSVAACLVDANVPGAQRDARLLVAHAAGIPPGRLTLHLRDPFTAEIPLAVSVEQRKARQPVSQIIGQRSFWGRPFEVTPDVLDPRPESEIIVAQALTEHFSSVLDLGTGSGCLVVTLLAERPTAQGVGTDFSCQALEVAARNAKRHRTEAQMNWSNWWSEVTGRFDLIVSNPPYISTTELPNLAPEVRDWEPTIALTDGGDGLGAYRVIASGAPDHLVPGGRLLLEHGPGQERAISEMLLAAGLEEIDHHDDFDKRKRVISARRGREN